MLPASAPKKKPLVNVYVDGFNLYYGALHGTAYKWLDIHKLAVFMLPEYDIGRIRYFTARVKARPNDPQKPTRQDAYLRALLTLPNVTVHEGFFLESQPYMRLVTPVPCQAATPCIPNLQTVRVHKSEEKGSDVNIATWMLTDAMDQDGDATWMVSNDSDLYAPLAVLAQRFSRPIGILNPYPNASRLLKQLVQPANNRHLRPRALQACLLPDPVTDSRGNAIHKPHGW